jgi:hypothetical protein
MVTARANTGFRSAAFGLLARFKDRPFPALPANCHGKRTGTPMQIAAVHDGIGIRQVPSA